LCEGAEGADACAEEGGFVVGAENLEGEALQGRHFYHRFNERAQRGEVEEAYVVAGKVKAAWAGEMNEGCRRRGQGAVP
jgi:hypothetical protein